jgi:hypothetical protein
LIVFWHIRQRSKQSYAGSVASLWRSIGQPFQWS